MKLSELSEAIAILAPYYTDGIESYNIGAEHDQIYLYATDRPLSEADAKRMCKLGWVQEGVDDMAGEYDPNEGWYAFT